MGSAAQCLVMLWEGYLDGVAHAPARGPRCKNLCVRLLSWCGLSPEACSRRLHCLQSLNPLICRSFNPSIVQSCNPLIPQSLSLSVFECFYRSILQSFNSNPSLAHSSIPPFLRYSLHPSVCPSLCSFLVRPSAHLAIPGPSIRPSVRLCIRLSIPPSVRFVVPLPIRSQFIMSFIHLFIRPVIDCSTNQLFIACLSCASACTCIVLRLFVTASFAIRIPLSFDKGWHGSPLLLGGGGHMRCVSLQSASLYSTQATVNIRSMVSAPFFKGNPTLIGEHPGQKSPYLSYPLVQTCSDAYIMHPFAEMLFRHVAWPFPAFPQSFPLSNPYHSPLSVLFQCTKTESIREAPVACLAVASESPMASDMA